MTELKKKFEALKEKGEELVEQGNKFSKVFGKIEDFETDVCMFGRELNNDDTLTEDEVDEMMEELWDIKYETTSWLPSSMQC